ncbi:MAG: hypothetical protein M5U26_07205 [Planctomycetota bacterium]|nr:hypothetical protein [Planctomycetota bacterium]
MFASHHEKKLHGRTKLTLMLSAGSLCLVLSGCGGGAPVQKAGAAKELKVAEESLTRADSLKSQGELDTAIAALREGLSAAQSGRRKALAREKPALSDLEEQITKQISAFEGEKQKAKIEKELAKKKEEEQKKLAELRKAQGVAEGGAAPAIADPEEAARKKKEEERKKAEEEQKRLAALMVKKDEKTEKTEEGDAPPEVAAQPGEEGDKPKVAAAPKPDGPFRPLGADPRPLTIDVVRSKDKYAFAYFQVFNKDENIGKRIGRVTVIFKDNGNGVIGEAHGTFDYSKFDKSKADPLEQPDGCGLTAESHEVPAGKALQLVAIADFDNANSAKRATKCTVQIDFAAGSGGGTISENGPGSALDVDNPAKPPIPGL